MTLKGQTRDPSTLGALYLENGWSWDSVPKAAYGISNGHVTDDVTWPQKVKLMTSIRLQRNILKTAGDAI